jgi:hypothetical protein
VIETGHRTDSLTQAVVHLAASYRALPQSKLLALLPDGRSRAEAGYRFAARLAAFGQGVEERALDAPPTWRSLPFDGEFIVGDQIAVTGHDLAAGIAGLDDLDELVWTVDGDRVRAGELLAGAIGEAGALQRAL